MPLICKRLALLSVLCAAVTATQPIDKQQQQQQQGSLRKLQGKSNTQVPIGFQSGPDPGATYGGSVVYSPDSGRIYVTGSTKGNYFKSPEESAATKNEVEDNSCCFVGIATIPKANDASAPLTWIHSQQWDTDVPEACNVIYVDSNPNNLPENNTGIQEKMYLLGYTAKNGLMDSLRMESTFSAKQYGMLMDMDVLTIPEGASTVSTTFWGGRILQDGPVQYPIDMTTDEDGNIYVVSLQTYDANPSKSTTRPEQVAKQMVDPELKPFGSEYNMLVEQFLYDNPGYDDGVGLPADPANVPVYNTIVDNWRKPYSPSGTGQAIVSGVEYLGGLLVIVGSTNGHGQVFGNEVFTNSNKTDTTMNGFMTKLIPESGSYYQFVADNGVTDAKNQPAHKKSSSGIASWDFADDYIMGMCSAPKDPDYFYIVGTTAGQIDRGLDTLVRGEIHAFIAKIDLWTLLPVWIKQIGGNAVNKDVVRGMVCAVTDDAKDVYMAGVVENGGSLSLYSQDSHGGDDIFLFQAATDDGRLAFVRQIGTSGNDRLSSGGLATDEFGNAILMGHTDGSFYRSRQFDQETEKTNDLFIMTVMRGSGDYKEPVVPEEKPLIEVPTATAAAAATATTAHPETTQAPVPPAQTVPPTSVATTTPPTKEQITTAEDTPGEESNSATFKPIAKEPTKPLIYTVSGHIDRDTDAPQSSPNVLLAPRTTEDDRYGLLIFLVLIGAVSIVSALLVYRKLTEREVMTDRSTVLEYLHDFDVDDIDLKQSATGGYHCSYTNDLAYGINAKTAGREGLFGPNCFSSRTGTTEDPLLAVHTRSPPISGEISFTDEPDRDDISSIGSGIGRPGRHSTHGDDPLVDAYDMKF